jgi:hypothetical protein
MACATTKLHMVWRGYNLRLSQLKEIINEFQLPNQYKVSCNIVGYIKFKKHLVGPRLHCEFIVVEGGLLWWCGFNALVLTREERRWDEALPEDELERVSSPWFNGKKTWNGASAWWCLLEKRQHRGGERDEMALVGLTWILLGRKIKKNQRSRFSCFKWTVKI